MPKPPPGTCHLWRDFGWNRSARDAGRQDLRWMASPRSRQRSHLGAPCHRSSHYGSQLAKLNALIHPHVKIREKALAAEFGRLHPDGIAVTEAAILVETGSYKVTTV